MKIHWPKIAIPEGFESAESYLRHLVYEGAKENYGKESNYFEYYCKEDVEHELKCFKGYEPYFILIYNLISFCRSEGIMVGPGHGTAASSLVNYCLGITQVDPSPWLIFESFFLRGVDNIPHIDIVVEDARREEIIQYLKDTYGEDCVLKAGFGYRHNQERNCFERVPVYDVHAFGICIFDRPYYEVTDTIEFENEETSAKTLVPHLTMQELESMGYICIYIIGLKMLTLVSKTLRQIEQNKNIHVDYNDIPNEDPDTMEFLSSGHEDIGKIWCSKPLTEIMADAKPTYMEELCAINAIWRPKLYHNIDKFIALMKNDATASVFEIFDEYFYESSRGLLLFNEQILLTLSMLSGIDHEGCERMRRHMDYPGYEPSLNVFMENVARYGLHDPKEAKSIWKYFMENHKKVVSQSHSMCMTTIMYRNTWLRVHYPEEFKAISILNQ